MKHIHWMKFHLSPISSHVHPFEYKIQLQWAYTMHWQYTHVSIMCYSIIIHFIAAQHTYHRNFNRSVFRLEIHATHSAIQKFEHSSNSRFIFTEFTSFLKLLCSIQWDYSVGLNYSDGCMRNKIHSSMHVSHDMSEASVCTLSRPHTYIHAFVCVACSFSLSHVHNFWKLFVTE